MSALLVTGANGQLGRLVVEQLLTAGQHNVIAASRDPSKLADLAARGAQTRRADFDDATSLAEAFTGVDRVLIISTDALGEPGKRLEQHRKAVAAAQKAGVSDIVYTSMPNPETSAVTFAPDHLGTEQAIKASGLAFTILRNAWYQENLLHSLPAIVGSGKWYSAAGEGRNAHVSRLDCARAAAAALSRPSRNETLTITGPELLTVHQIAALTADVLGRPIEVINVTDAQLAEGMKHAGLPEFLIPTFVSFDTNARQGGFDIKTDAVEQLTGRAPLPLRAFLEANAKAIAG